MQSEVISLGYGFEVSRFPLTSVFFVNAISHWNGRWMKYVRESQKNRLRLGARAGIGISCDNFWSLLPDSKKRRLQSTSVSDHLDRVFGGMSSDGRRVDLR
jgi:hypothetical protein